MLFLLNVTFYKSSFLSHSLISQSVINSCKFNLLTIYAQDEISKNALKTYLSKLFGRGVLYTLLQKNNVSIHNTHTQKGRIYFRFMRVSDNTLHQYGSAILFVLKQKGLELMTSINLALSVDFIKPFFSLWNKFLCCTCIFGKNYLFAIGIVNSDIIYNIFF